ncbi:MAG: phosphatase PAP2 family protein [Bosea sp. (in: a-proteobacteria)]
MMMTAFPAANLALIRAFALPFALLGLSFGLGLLAFGWLGITMDAGSWRTIGLIIAISTSVVLAAARLGNVVATSSALCVALFLMMPAPLAMFSYACAGLGANLPLMDTTLARIDAAYGFDWLGAVSWFNQHPTLVWLLGHAYHGTIVPLIYVLVLLNVLGRRDRIVAFMTLFIGTCVAANILSGLVPAIGAYVHFAPGETLRSAISNDAGVWHLAQFEALRAGTLTQFKLTATEGLVTFPSFHTAAALCVPLALRGLGALTALAWAVAGAIIISTIPIGGHYLIDVIAGAAMTFALHALLVRAKVGEAAMREPGSVDAAPQPALIPAGTN